MINLSKPFGAFLCTVQTTFVTLLALYATAFLPGWFAALALAVFLGLFFIGATQFFDRILSFSDRDRARWVSFTPLLASAVLWGAALILSSFRTKMASLANTQVIGTIGAPADLSAISPYGPTAILSSYGSSAFAPILLQLGLLTAAYLLIIPSIRSGALPKRWLLLPLVGPALGTFLGWLITTTIVGV